MNEKDEGIFIVFSFIAWLLAVVLTAAAFIGGLMRFYDWIVS